MPTLPSPGAQVRPEEILSWLKAWQGEPIEAWCAVDDRPLLMERGGLVSADPQMSEARQLLLTNLETQKAKGGSERVAKAIEETEEKASKANLDKILEEINVTTGRGGGP